MNMSNKIKQAWEKRDDETHLAFTYFSSYLQLGADRSLMKVVEKHEKKEHYKTQLGIWSSKYAWVYRAAEYDQYLIKKQLNNKEEAIEFSKGEMLGLLSKAVRAIREVLMLPNYSESTGVSSNAMARIKAAEAVFDRVGLVKHKEPEKVDDALERKKYIQNIYQKINNYCKENDQSNESGQPIP